MDGVSIKMGIVATRMLGGDARLRVCQNNDGYMVCSVSMLAAVCRTFNVNGLFNQVVEGVSKL